MPRHVKYDTVSVDVILSNCLPLPSPMTVSVCRCIGLLRVVNSPTRLYLGGSNSIVSSKDCV